MTVSVLLASCTSVFRWSASLSTSLWPALNHGVSWVPEALNSKSLTKEGFIVDEEEQRNLINKSKLFLETIDALHSLHSSTETFIVDSKNATKVETESVEVTKEHIRDLSLLKEAYYSTSQGQQELLKYQIDE